MKEIRATLFASSTAKGRELIDLLAKAFSSECPIGCKVHMETVENGDQGDMMIAGLRDDIVIFDASVEDSIGANYKAAQMWPSCMEHFLVVSRTWLPLNFQPYHEGGFPEASENIFEFDNYKLVGWIIKKLEILNDNLPRPSDEHINLEKNQFSSQQKAVHEISEKLILNSIRNKDEYRKNSGRAFVSYLSSYSRQHVSKKKFHGFHVEDIIDHIRKYHKTEDYPVKYYPPGTLSSEFMTEHRRWQVLSIIDWRIRASDEFWVFETPDYYDSWWTLAELASLAYINSNTDGANEMLPNTKHRVPKIFLCKPTVDEVLEVKQTEPDYFVQQLDKTLAREFGRRLSNSDPLTMGRESISNMQTLAKLPVPIQWLTIKGVGLFASLVMRNSPMYKEMKKSNQGAIMDFDQYREMLHSPVFSKGFWNDRIVSCQNCNKVRKFKHDFDFCKWLNNKLSGQFRVSEEEMNKILDSGLWACPSCGFKYRIIKESNPLLIWWPVRMGKATGPNGAFVEELPNYSLLRAD